MKDRGDETLNQPKLTTHAELQQKIDELEKEVDSNKQQLRELKQRSDIQSILNKILRISLDSPPLTEQLDQILQLVLSLEWLTLEEMGCIFLVDEHDKSLSMSAHHNLSKTLLTMCNKVAFGRRLCGKAAQSQELIFKHCLDSDHENRYEGIVPHGHHIIPIISNNRTLGVLNLYVKHGHRQSAIEIEYLSTCSSAIAGIIERKNIEKRLQYLSLHDELTGLPNRRHLFGSIEQLIKSSKRNKKKFAVLYMDLDGFKDVNDKHSHAFGDELLKQSSKRVRDFIRESDLFARLGGDEFIIIAEDIDETNGLRTFGQKIIDCISQPYCIENVKVTIGSSIGISIYPDHAENTDHLLLCADKALYAAKQQRGQVMFYHSSHDGISAVNRKNQTSSD